MASTPQTVCLANVADGDADKVICGTTKTVARRPHACLCFDLARLNCEPLQ